MATKEARNRAQYKYSSTHLKRVPLDMQKADYDAMKSHAEAQGESVNGFIKRAVSETMERDKIGQRAAE